MASQLELHRLNTNRQVPVVAANRMLKQMLFRYQVRERGRGQGGTDKLARGWIKWGEEGLKEPRESGLKEGLEDKRWGGEV